MNRKVNQNFAKKVTNIKDKLEDEKRELEEDKSELSQRKRGVVVSALEWIAPLLVDIIDNDAIKETVGQFAGRKKSLSPVLTKTRMY